MRMGVIGAVCAVLPAGGARVQGQLPLPPGLHVKPLPPNVPSHGTEGGPAQRVNRKAGVCSGVSND
jgi:hypothetical protein